VLSVGWLLYGVSPLLRLFSSSHHDPFGLLYGLTATLGILIITLGALSYMHGYPRRTVLAAAPAIIAGALLLWVSPWESALNIYFPVLQLIILMTVFSRIVFNFRSFIAVGGRSYYWAAAVMAVGALHALAYLTVYPDYPDFPLPFAMTMVLTVMLIVFFIHLEHAMMLREKENLLAEVHHRVRNNLQLVESLLSIEGAYRSPGEYEKLVRDVYQKIHSISLIHELVYEEGSYESFDIAAYARRLCEEVTGVRESGTTVTCSVTAVPLFLPMERIIPLGMVLQEALENAAVHASSGGRDVKITVEIEAGGRGRGSCCIMDSGPGFPAGFDPDSESSLGFTLINHLVRQFAGSLEIERRKGGCLRVEFPL
jgi:two-component sensor histidine kinase